MPGTDGTPDYDSGSHCQTDDHDGQHVHDLTADGHGRRAGHALVLADDEQGGSPYHIMSVKNKKKDMEAQNIKSS